MDAQFDPRNIRPNKEGIFNIAFGKYSKRHENTVLLHNPFPGDSRFAPPNAHEKQFDLPPLNLDVLSKNRRQASIPKLDSYTKRPEFVKIKGITADFNNH